MVCKWQLCSAGEAACRQLVLHMSMTADTACTEACGLCSPQGLSTQPCCRQAADAAHGRGSSQSSGCQTHLRGP